MTALSQPLIVHAPEFLLVEAANVLWKKRRNGGIGPDDPADMLAFIASASVTYHANGPLIARALEIAIATTRTVYDCIYLALAELLKATLVTADERFVNGLAGTPWATMTTTLSSWAESRTKGAI